MAAKKLKLVLNTDENSAECGNFSVEATGYNGKGCDVDVHAFLTQGDTTKSVKKPEYKTLTQGRVQANA